MTYHPQVFLLGAVDVDELLAPVIEALWESGYTTRYSCQGAPEGNIAAGRGYITGPLTNATGVSGLVECLQNAGLRNLQVTVTSGRWNAAFDALDGTPVAPHVFVEHHWRVLDLDAGTFETL